MVKGTKIKRKAVAAIDRIIEAAKDLIEAERQLLSVETGTRRTRQKKDVQRTERAGKGGSIDAG